MLVLVLVLVAQRALARGCSNSQTAFSPKDSLDLAETLFNVSKTLVDDGIDALVNDGRDGVWQG